MPSPSWPCVAVSCRGRLPDWSISSSMEHSSLSGKSIPLPPAVPDTPGSPSTGLMSLSASTPSCFPLTSVSATSGVTVSVAVHVLSISYPPVFVPSAVCLSASSCLGTPFHMFSCDGPLDKLFSAVLLSGLISWPSPMAAFVITASLPNPFISVSFPLSPTYCLSFLEALNFSGWLSLALSIAPAEPASSLVAPSVAFTGALSFSFGCLLVSEPNNPLSDKSQVTAISAGLAVVWPGTGLGSLTLPVNAIPWLGLSIGFMPLLYWPVVLILPRENSAWPGIAGSIIDSVW